jgi:hypothetical protein
VELNWKSFDKSTYQSRGGTVEMRIVAWNCNTALHSKYEQLLSLRPDIAVISECADVEQIAQKATNFNPSSAIWIGDNPHKGLSVLTFGSFNATLSAIYQKDFPYIAPVQIGGPMRFNLMAVWACHSNVVLTLW